jgi:hypothetical protein
MRVETVAREISEALQKNAVYLISDADLRQLWPDLQQRYTQIKEFAAAHGWRLFAYGDGRGAMFIRKGKATPDVRSKVDLENIWSASTALSSCKPAELDHAIVSVDASDAVRLMFTSGWSFLQMLLRPRPGNWWCGTAQPIASSVSQTQLRDSRRMAGR